MSSNAPESTYETKMVLLLVTVETPYCFCIIFEFVVDCCRAAERKRRGSWLLELELDWDGVWFSLQQRNIRF